MSRCKTVLHEDLIDWRDCFQDLFSKYTEQGVALRGFRLRDEMTQSKLAQILNVNQASISKMEHGKRPIGKDIAKRFAKLFHTDYRVFL